MGDELAFEAYLCAGSSMSNEVSNSFWMNLELLVGLIWLDNGLRAISCQPIHRANHVLCGMQISACSWLRNDGGECFQG